MAANVISNPDKFFQELMQKEIDLKKPFLIILIVALIASVNQYFIVSKIAEAFPSDLSSILKIGAYAGVIGSLVALVVVWVIISLIIFAVSSIFGGQGSFNRLFEFTGYGFIPSIFSSLITTSVTIHYISNASVPKLSMADIKSGEFGRELMKTLLPQDVVYFNLIVSIAFMIWSFTIWTFGVKNARALDIKKAIESVLIPLIVYVGYTVYAILNFL